MKRKPVHIITGFLGAGKTTVLNALIRDRQPERMLVIENEVGSTNVDSTLVVPGVEDVLELTAGCLCCSLSDGLIDLLEEAHRRRDTYDRLLIETTGVADPEGLIYPFIAHPAVERDFEMANVICVVDALNVEQWLEETEEARRQISFADALLISKVDEASPEQVEKVKELLKGINPMAQIFTGAKGDFPYEEVMDIRQFANQGAVANTRSVKGTHTHSHTDIKTFSLPYDRAFDLKKLYHELARVLQVNKHQIYRIKGLVQAHDYPVQVVLQSVNNSIYLSDGEPWDTSPDERASQLVCIGKGIKKEAMDRIFRRALV